MSKDKQMLAVAVLFKAGFSFSEIDKLLQFNLSETYLRDYMKKFNR